jgi:RimJ/RimL family protein N-acetyltransferase
VIETERLVLRPWAEADRPAWRAMMAEPDVAYWLGGLLTPEESDAAFDRGVALIEADGFGIWAAERKADGRIVGAIGVRRMPMAWNHPFSGFVEVGWRLTREAWGHGYATEGAAASIAWAFANLDIPEVVTFTADTNLRSQAVMERLGLTRTPERDFDHPTLAEDHPLRRHVVYVAPRPT